MQFIHGDLTDDNVVTDDPVTRVPDGVIDLGDLNRTWTVGELAITVSSLLHHDGMDLPGAMRAITAYHAIRPVSEVEADALWPLVVVRGAVLVASAHHVLATDAANEYAAENLVHEREIFAAGDIGAAGGGNRARAGGDGPLDVPPLEMPAADRAAARAAMPPMSGVVDFSPTSPALHERPMARGIRRRRSLRRGLAGARHCVARFGEPRLTRSRARMILPSRATWLSASRCGSHSRSRSPRPGRARSGSLDGGIELRH